MESKRTVRGIIKKGKTKIFTSLGYFVACCCPSGVVLDHRLKVGEGFGVGLKGVAR